MISYLRKAFSNKIVYRIAIWATVLALCGSLFFAGLYRRLGRTMQTVPEVVNGYEITQWELRRKVDQEHQRIGMIRRQFGNQADLILRMHGLSEDNVQEHALASLRQQKLLTYAADKLGIELSPHYVARKLGDRDFVLMFMGDYVSPAMVSGDTINYNALYKVLQRQGISPSCFEDIVDERLKGVAVLNMVNGGVYVPTSDMLDTFNSHFRRKKFFIAKMPLATFIKQLETKPIAEADLKSFFQATQQNYLTPEKRSGIYWSFPNGSEQFKQDANGVVAQEGAAFDAFVAKYKGVKHSMGPMTYRADALTRALFNIPVGKRAAFVEGKQGFVVQTSLIEPAVQQIFDQVHDKVRADYIQSQASSRARNELEITKTMNKKELHDWVAAHKEYGIQTSTTDFLDQHDEAGWKPLRDQLGGSLFNVVMMSQEGQVLPLVSGANAYVIQLDQLEPFDAQAFEKKKSELHANLSNMEVSVWMSGFIASLEKNATIKTKNKP